MNKDTGLNSGPGGSDALALENSQQIGGKSFKILAFLYY